MKLDNIFLTPGGQAKLGDLALLKDLEGELELTQPGKGLGTPEFMAPEQFSDARNAGVPCDTYSLGATLYTAVTGKLPFEGRSLAAVLRKKLHNELVPPRQLTPALSERVDWAIRRALQANPRQRQASCPEFIQSLTGEAAAPAPAGGEALGPASERRRAVRYPCALATVCHVEVSIHGDEAEVKDRWEGTVQNLSVTGVRLLLPRRFGPGTQVTVVLEDPGRTVRRSLELQVHWAKRVRTGQWSVGGKFREPLDKDDLRKLV